MNSFFEKRSPERPNAHLEGVLWVSLLVAFAAISILLVSNRKMRIQLQDARLSFLDGACLRADDWVTGFQSRDVNGVDFELRFGAMGQRRLIQMVSADCAASAQQVEDWWPLVTSDPRLRDLEPLLISLDSAGRTKARWGSMHTTTPMLAMPGMDFRRAYRVAKVPLLALVSSTGRVEWTYRGVLDESDYLELVDLVRTQSEIAFHTH